MFIIFHNQTLLELLTVALLIFALVSSLSFDLTSCSHPPLQTGSIGAKLWDFLSSLPEISIDQLHTWFWQAW